MLWGLLLCALLIVFFFFLIKRFDFFLIEGVPRSWIYAALLLKLLAGSFLFILYSSHYQNRAEADIFKYFDDAQLIKSHENFSAYTFYHLLTDGKERSDELSSILKNTQHWDRGKQLLPNDNRTMIMMNLLLLFISKGFYFFHLAVFSILSFMGGMGMLHFFKRSSTIPSKWLFAAVFIAPSVCLWTSGLLKESLFIFFFGMFLNSLSLIEEKIKINTLLLLLMSLMFLVFLKSYLLICFLPALMIYQLNRLGNRWLSILGFGSILILLLIFRELLLSELVRVQQNFMELAEESNANSSFSIQSINSFKDLLLGIPAALYNVWLRPIFTINSNPFIVVNAVESACYLLIWIAPIVHFNSKWKLDKSILALSISFVLISSILIGSTIPILGAVVRYRSPILIFYLLTVFTFVDWKKLQLRIK